MVGSFPQRGSNSCDIGTRVGHALSAANAVAVGWADEEGMGPGTCVGLPAR
jgi:hypothetical protein